MTRRISRFLFVAAILVAPVLAQAQPTLSTTDYSVAPSVGITIGPDGAMWVVETAPPTIARVDTNGKYTQFPIPLGTVQHAPRGIAAGSDGALWFTDYGAIGRMTTAGAVTVYPLPDPTSIPNAITAGPDGALWFTQYDAIGRITVTGTITEFPLTATVDNESTYVIANGIVSGPDGALWFTTYSGTAPSTVGRITSAGVITEYAIPTGGIPLGIAVGPDGALWFVKGVGNKIGRITTAGVITEYPLPTPVYVGSAVPGDITAGADGAMWFVGQNGLGRVTMGGVITEVPVAGIESPEVITGPDGALWSTGPALLERTAINPAPGPFIPNPVLPPGYLGTAYSAAIGASGGTPPFVNWRLTGGSLPPGLALDTTSGLITGTPTASGTFVFVLTVQNSAGAASIPWTLSITITPPNCTYAISPLGLAFGQTGGTGTITISTGAGCRWLVGTPPEFVTFTSPTSGTGSGTVTFQVSPYSAELSGSFAIGAEGAGGGQNFAVEVEGHIYGNVGSMPHLAAGGGWTTTFTLVNIAGASTDPVSFTTDEDTRVSFFAGNGDPLALPMTFPQQPSSSGPLVGASIDRTLPSSASLIVQVSGPASTPFTEGSAQIQPSPGVDGFAIFHFTPTSQEAVVPLETGSSASWWLAFDNTHGVVTGVAVVSVSSQNAAISVVLRDDTGAQIGFGSIPLAASGHTSFLLATMFPITANIRGTVQFETFGLNGAVGGPISVLGIRYTPTGTLTTIPALANITTSGGSIAHLASGNGWQTTFVLVNTGTKAGQANLNFFDDSGSPLSLPLTILEDGASSTASSLNQTIPANASLWVQSAGPAGSALLTGSAQLTTTGDIAVFAIFRYNPNNQEAVVPMENRNAGTYVLAFDNTNNIATGVAIGLVSSQPANIPIVIRDDMGKRIGTGTISLNANGHTSFVLSTQYPATANIRGIVEFGTPASAQISVIGMRSPPALTFTTLPALAN